MSIQTEFWHVSAVSMQPLYKLAISSPGSWARPVISCCQSISPADADVILTIFCRTKAELN